MSGIGFGIGFAALAVFATSFELVRGRRASRSDTAEALTFRIAEPTGWRLLQVSATDYLLRSVDTVGTFRVNVVVTVFEGDEAPASLDSLVERIVRAHANAPLSESVASSDRVTIAGLPAARIVSTDADGLRYLTTILVDGARGFEIAGVAPLASFADYEPQLAAIADSFEPLSPDRPRPPPLPMYALLLAAELGGQPVDENIVWLFPAAIREKRALEDRIRQLADGGRVSLEVRPDYGRNVTAHAVPASLIVCAQREDGAQVRAVIRNRPAY